MLKTLLDVWDAASERMLAAVARRLARGITSEGWAVEKTRETLAVRDELNAIMARLDLSAPELVVKALGEAYGIGERAAATMREATISTRPEVVQQLAVRLVTHLQGAHVPVVASHLDLYRRTVTAVELDMQTGTITRREAIARTVDRLLAAGVDRFPAADGRAWHLDTYARMAGRTIAAQTAVQGQLDTMVADGRDLVIISDSARECENCRPWERSVLSISGRSVGTVVDGRTVEHAVADARAGGLWHPNCTHRADPFTPGLTAKPAPVANPDGYRAQQHLRALERQARELKRRRTAAQQIGDEATVRRVNASVREVGARINAHTEASGLLRRRERERPVGA
ncbi:MAG TPA: phage minor capsid protein [Actinophytocola sp.]|uniref:phage minor capsid protein n=1 Tax=Actinophytocola sp. TaxID=1872138 RepID=UPI002DBB7150|nr:phage minor capsid protein [Actinophytocola sp.]HEU5475695.1 phage minor capsid protein [Actinophytocola sp.]